MTTRRLLTVPLVVGALLLSGCGLSGCRAAAGASDAAGGPLPVVASFYPLQLAVEQIGGNHLSVTNLTRPGAEPHDIGLAPREVGTVSQARLVVFEKGFQGAVDKAVASEAADRGLDVALAAKLNLLFQPTVGADPVVRSPDGGGDSAAGTTDPHFWLDPQRYADVAKAISSRLSVLDPAHKADYQRNAEVFEDKLAALGQEFQAGLASCQRKDIVTSHAAFGYLAERFGMRQVAINGLSPDQEPKASDLASVSSYARAHGVTTIYAETLVSPAIAETVAQESGARLATLDPVEGLTEKSAGKDYFEVMRSNLRVLRVGQGCS